MRHTHIARFASSMLCVAALGMLAAPTHAAPLGSATDVAGVMVASAPMAQDPSHGVRPNSLCQGTSDGQYYYPVVGGKSLTVYVEWVLEPDCSHWISELEVTGSGYVNKISGTTIDATLGYNVGSQSYPTAYSTTNGCYSILYTTSFSGSFVPNTETPIAYAGLATSCSGSVTPYPLPDNVN